MENKLYRDEHHKKIAGVCAGLATYFNIDVSLVRALFILALILPGAGLPLYIVLWVVVPEKYTATVPSSEFYSKQPAAMSVKKSAGTATVFAGVSLMVMGIVLLLSQYNLIPDVDFGALCSVMLIIGGFALIFGFWQSKPREPNTASYTDHSKSADSAQTI